MLVALDSGHRLARLALRRGRPLQPGESSPSGVYLLCDRRSGVMLRASLLRSVAELHAEDPSRQLFEGVLDATDSVPGSNRAEPTR